jgi:hypothetical protein
MADLLRRMGLKRYLIRLIMIPEFPNPSEAYMVRRSAIINDTPLKMLFLSKTGSTTWLLPVSSHFLSTYKEDSKISKQRTIETKYRDGKTHTSWPIKAIGSIHPFIQVLHYSTVNAKCESIHSLEHPQVLY